MTPKHERPHRAAAESGWRHRLHTVIFEADTPAGRAFDLVLIACILASVGVVMLDSMEGPNARYGETLFVLEWVFTGLFTIEYILRLLCLRRPLRYAGSFLGVVDLLAILPSWLDLLLPGTRFLLAIRILRVLRVIRVLKLAHYIEEARLLGEAFRKSGRKIGIFLLFFLSLMVILGSLMYLIEGPEHGFTSIPRSIYWAIVTVTTVGYGDISPQTPLGQALAAMAMILGYAIIAVPTGVFSVEMSRTMLNKTVSTQACPDCGAEGHASDARHCKACGAAL